MNTCLARILATIVVGTVLTGAVCAEESQRRWLESLEAARDEALLNQRPILVRVGAEYCPWCKKLDEEIEKPLIQKELARWTLLDLDLDKSPDEAQRFGVGPIPALRILTSRGRLIASRDGYMDAESLAAWLGEQHEQAATAPDDALLASHEPSLLEVVRIVRQFSDRDATVREAAFLRLRPFPKVSAASVVKAFREGNLSSRLTAWELLHDWEAPVGTMDPWQPATMTEPQWVALDEWLTRIDAAAIPGFPRALTEAQLQQARADLDQLITIDKTESAIVRERLARWGVSLLPEVLVRLRDAATDEQRERLLALRYRLVANDSLVLSWPGGLERLADTNAAVRHRAAEELASMATVDQQPLLLALFSDPDPLVREISLRGLRHMGGEHAASALVELLQDPEHNVRAAVLKQLAEDKSLEMMPKVAAYLKTETDADLLVHAIRYFREIKSVKAVNDLLPLLEHESWQVRADAAEAIGTLVTERTLGSVPDNIEEIYAALLKRLTDKDAFVVNRALAGLKNVDAKHAVEPLVNAAASHPELAATVVDILARGSVMREAAVPHLQEFFRKPNSEVRAAAVRGLVKTDPEHVKDVLIAALNDGESRVRIAAAQSVLELIAVGQPTPSSGYGDLEGKSELARDKWLTQLYAGKKRAAWLNEVIEPLEKMLAASEPEERLAAGLALVPFNRHEKALPVVLGVASENPALYFASTKVLEWLVRDRRVEVFWKLFDLAHNETERTALVHQMSSIADERNGELYFRVLERAEVTALIAGAIQEGLRNAFLGSRYYDPSTFTESMKKRIASAIESRLSSKSPRQLLAAMDLMMFVDAEKALSTAKQIMDDSQQEESLRRDAFVIAFATQPDRDRMETAAAALTSSDPFRQSTALKFLALGDSALSKLPSAGFDLQIGDGLVYLATPGQPVALDPPARLTAEQIKPLSAQSNPETAAYAGYLLTLFGDSNGLAPLLAHWKLQRQNSELDRLVYRAISALNDSTQIPVLKQIYGRLSPSDKGQFYWTIRSMTGPEILEFRKKIRDEVGMENLR